ncbi:hypothetical protein GCM10027578_38450 [Spirosoma luteolum]
MQGAVAFGIVGVGGLLTMTDVIEAHHFVISFEGGGDVPPHVLITAEPVSQHQGLCAVPGHRYIISFLKYLPHTVKYNV